MEHESDSDTIIDSVLTTIPKNLRHILKIDVNIIWLLQLRKGSNILLFVIQGRELKLKKVFFF